MYKRTSKTIYKAKGPSKTTNMLVVERRRCARSGEHFLHEGFNFHESYKIKTFRFLKRKFLK